MVADPNPAVIETVRHLLDEDGRAQVVASAGTGEECLKKLKIAKPNVLIAELKFPDMGIGRIIRQCSEWHMDLAVLVLSAQATKGTPILEAALLAGAFDFIKRPRNVKELDTLARQILTNVFVASFSKTKLIPKRVGGPDPAAAAEANERRDLELVIAEAPASALREVRELIGLLPPKPKAALVVLLRRDAALVRDLVEDVKRQVPIPLHAAGPGDFIIAGNAYLVPLGSEDVVLERTLTGWIELKLAGSGDPSVESHPCIRVAFESAARLYGRKCAALLLDGDGPERLDALAATRTHGTLTLISEKAAGLLSLLPTRFPKGEIPDDIVALPQVQALFHS